MGSWEHGNEPLNSIKRRKFPDQLSDYQLAKDSLQWSEWFYENERITEVEIGICFITK
jgi:hypothetical protein